MMTEKEYHKALGRLEACKCLDDATAQKLIEVVEKMESLLDEADSVELFGTDGGWRMALGWA